MKILATKKFDILFNHIRVCYAHIDTLTAERDAWKRFAIAHRTYHNAKACLEVTKEIEKEVDDSEAELKQRGLLP